jgi:hypothetical protein
MGAAVPAEGPPDADDLAARLRGATAARGSVLATPEGARAVLAAGVRTVVRLPGQSAVGLLLALVQETIHPEEEKTP